MSQKVFYKAALNTLNVIYCVSGVVTAAVGILFFLQVTEFVSLRNRDHYLFDYKVYWPQAVPWLFIVIGIFLLLTAMCGVCGATMENQGILRTYCFFLIIIIVLQVIAAVLIFVCVDGEYTDKFVTDIVYDGFKEAQSKEDAFKSFGKMEQKLRCCGSDNARAYKIWRSDLPLTCCSDGHNRTKCAFNDKEANERHGCAKVASFYIKLISSIVAAGSLLVALLEIGGVILACKSSF